VTLALASLSAFAEDTTWIAEARRVAAIVPPKLLAVLSEQIAKVGPEGAVPVCRDLAPQMARAASEETGWNIRRVSLKNRNPKAVPDAWERAALEDFDRRVAAGELPTALDKAEIVTLGDRKEYRYIKALPAQEFCLQCHGTPVAFTANDTLNSDPNLAAAPGVTGGANFGIGGLQTQNTLCSAPVNQSGGTFRCNAALWLGVPASAGAGTYTGGLVLTLV